MMSMHLSEVSSGGIGVCVVCKMKYISLSAYVCVHQSLCFLLMAFHSKSPAYVAVALGLKLHWVRQGVSDS